MPYDPVLPNEMIDDDDVRTVRERIEQMPQFESYDAYCNLIRSTGAVYRARTAPPQSRPLYSARPAPRSSDPPACLNAQC